MKKVFFVLMLALTTTASAQRNEIAVLGGGQVALIPNASNGTGFAVQGSYSHRLAAIPFVSLWGEIPVMGTFSISRNLPAALGSRDYSALYVTPGVKLKVGGGGVKAYFVAGAGLAHFREDSSLAFAASNTTNVVDFGGGTEFGFGPAAFLLEVRDYYSGPLRFDPTLTDRQHNVAAMAGISLRF